MISTNQPLMEISKLLTDAIVNKTPRYSLSGKLFYGKAVSLYDGDTFDVVLYTPQILRHTIRMLGYNAPEIKQPKCLPEEVRSKLGCQAQEAKIKLSNLLGLDLEPKDRPILMVECGVWDKYGRLLATIYNNDVCINNLMTDYCNQLDTKFE